MRSGFTATPVSPQALLQASAASFQRPQMFLVMGLGRGYWLKFLQQLMSPCCHCWHSQPAQLGGSHVGRDTAINRLVTEEEFEGKQSLMGPKPMSSYHNILAHVLQREL